MTILEECGIEVAIPSPSNPENTSYVVISRETERFVNEVHTHNTNIMSSKELLEHLQEPEGKVATRFKETWADTSTLETRAGSVRLNPNKAPIFTRRTIPKHDKNWIVIRATSKYGGALAASISKTVTKTCRHFDQEERESDGSRHWHSMNHVLERRCARDGARNFSDEAWLQKVFEASTTKRIEHCKDKDGFSCHLRAIQGHSGGIPIEPKLMGYVFIPLGLKKKISQRTFMELPIHIGTWIDSGRKGERQRPSDSLSNTNESFWTRP